MDDMRDRGMDDGATPAGAGGEVTAGADAPRSGLAEIESDPPRTPGRVDAGEAVTGTRGGSSGEAPPGGIPGDDSSLEGGNPA